MMIQQRLKTTLRSALPLRFKAVGNNYRPTSTFRLVTCTSWHNDWTDPVQQEHANSHSVQLQAEVE